jgi:hypothetical protein
MVFTIITVCSILQSQVGSLLLRLPPEIRNRIHELTLDLGCHQVYHEDHHD